MAFEGMDKMKKDAATSGGSGWIKLVSTKRRSSRVFSKLANSVRGLSRAALATAATSSLLSNVVWDSPSRDSKFAAYDASSITGNSEAP